MRQFVLSLVSAALLFGGVARGGGLAGRPVMQCHATKASLVYDRPEHSEDANVIGRLEPGQQVSVYAGDYGEFYAIAWRGGVGYVPKFAVSCP